MSIRKIESKLTKLIFASINAFLPYGKKEAAYKGMFLYAPLIAGSWALHKSEGMYGSDKESMQIFGWICIAVFFMAFIYFMLTTKGKALKY